MHEHQKTAIPGRRAKHRPAEQWEWSSEADRRRVRENWDRVIGPIVQRINRINPRAAVPMCCGEEMVEADDHGRYMCLKCFGAPR